MKFIYHTDPSHGWVAVPHATLVASGVAEQISRCSHSCPASKTCYLEEDRDATLFIEAFRAQGNTIELSEQHTDSHSFVRRLPSYIP